MLDFLEKYGIKREVINSLEDTLSRSMQYNINCNELEIRKIINFLNGIGINCIDDLFINDTDLFLLSFREVKNKFGKQDIGKLVDLINTNCEILSQL